MMGVCQTGDCRKVDNPHMHVRNFSIKIGYRPSKQDITRPGCFTSRRKKWLVPIGICSILFLCTLVGGGNFSRQSLHRSTQSLRTLWLPQLSRASSTYPLSDKQPGVPLPPPAIAYLIMGSKGSSEQMQRLLLAVWHPHNEYLLHLDLEATADEHRDLADWVGNETMFQECENVQIISQPNLVTYTGPTMLATTLHGMAILLKKRKDWKWFINLSAADYPLAPQDDIMYALSKVNESRNFVQLWPRASWKVSQRTKPIVMDVAIFHAEKQDLVYLPAQRIDPTIFKLVTGSAWVILSRSFVEYVIMGWENLPRLALMYFTNTVSSPEGYLHTVLCNSDFRRTLINTDLHYITWDTPPKQHPRTLLAKDFPAMAESGAMFARKFTLNASESLGVLDRIDAELLGRAEGGFSPGGWCHQEEKERFKGGNPRGGSRENREEKGAKFLGVDLLTFARSKTGRPFATGKQTSGLAGGAGKAAEKFRTAVLESHVLEGSALVDLARNMDNGSGEGQNERVEGTQSSIRGSVGRGDGDADVLGNQSVGESGQMTGGESKPAWADSPEDNLPGEEAESEPKTPGDRETVTSGKVLEWFQHLGDGPDGSATGVKWADRLKERVAKARKHRSGSQELLGLGAIGQQGEDGLVDPLDGAPEAEREGLAAEADQATGAGADKNLDSVKRFRTVLADSRSLGVEEQVQDEDTRLRRRGCDLFDGSFFLKPSERVHNLIDLINQATESSEDDLCSLFHDVVTSAPSDPSTGA